ncbi:unnamed protein product [Paramecium pentaurelia]|uniref:Protein kinase domain-containing protein n=1 Tax=Paramecium pentaurelia TaxID=43138 RepID=A0A8S1VHC2_9CILI|nr:unnamed protein product [Paramecium pentaurelia]
MEDIQLIIRRIKRSGEPRLNLSGKQMISIPPEIYQLKLVHLDLSYNKITSIEPRILQLTTLEELDLSKNCIEEIPEELLSMSNLQSLNLTDNPLINKFQILNGHFHQPQLNQILQKLFQISPGSYQQQPKQEQKIIPERPQTQSRAIRQIQELQHTNHVLEVESNEFEVHEIISQGGFSIVHRGYFRGTEIAIKKIFNPNITQQLLDEINNEIEMLSLLRHPNIVLLMACCTKPPNLVIATEFIQGGSLYHLLHKTNHQISDQLKYSIAIQIARTLQYMHQAGVVHRDIKSHNILLQGQTVKFCDFGLTKRCSELNQGYQQFSGTPTYMAPELFAKRAYDKGVDLFAYGTLLWEIFAREVPWDCLEMQEIVQKTMKNEQLPGRNVPKNIMQLVNELRSKDETKRPTMDIVVKQLLSR